MNNRDKIKLRKKKESERLKNKSNIVHKKTWLDVYTISSMDDWYHLKIHVLGPLRIKVTIVMLILTFIFIAIMSII